MTFDITGDRDGQSVKTEYAVRRIPVLSGYWISASNANLPTFEPVGRATSSKLVLGRRRPGASRVAAGQRHRVEESLSDHRPPDIGPQPQAHAAPPRWTEIRSRKASSVRSTVIRPAPPSISRITSPTGRNRTRVGCPDRPPDHTSPTNRHELGGKNQFVARCAELFMVHSVGGRPHGAMRPLKRPNRLPLLPDPDQWQASAKPSMRGAACKRSPIRSATCAPKMTMICSKRRSTSGKTIVRCMNRTTDLSSSGVEAAEKVHSHIDSAMIGVGLANRP